MCVWERMTFFRGRKGCENSIQAELCCSFITKFNSIWETVYWVLNFFEGGRGRTFKKQDFSLPCSDGYPFDEFLISKKQLETCLFACRSSSLPNFARRNTGNSRNSTISHKDVSTLNDSVQDTALRMHWFKKNFDK